MNRLSRLLRAPVGLLMVACLAVAGWALWSGGVFDGPIAATVRSSSVYVAPGTGLDRDAAAAAIGNRRLVVILLAPETPDATMRETCDDVERAADGTVVLIVSRDADEYDTYGCALLPERDDANFGRAYVAESIIGSGIDVFHDSPLDMVKTTAVNYDQLVRAGTVPDGARVISPSLPRYLLAAAALAAVVFGAAALYVGARRAGRLSAARVRRRELASDERSELSAAAAGLAQQIIDLDGRYAGLTSRTGSRWTHTPADRDFVTGYRDLVADYATLMTAVALVDADPTGTSPTGADPAESPRTLLARLDSLGDRAARLAAGRPARRSRRSRPTPG